jgi:hypothetical protein
MHRERKLLRNILFPTYACRSSDPAFHWSANSMPEPKFFVGEIVRLLPAVGRKTPWRVYEVTEQLPADNGERHYRIKSIYEPNERVVRESEIYKT